MDNSYTMFGILHVLILIGTVISICFGVKNYIECIVEDNKGFKKSILELKNLFKNYECLYCKESKCFYLKISETLKIPLSNDLPDYFYKAIIKFVLKNNDYKTYFYDMFTVSFEEWEKVLREKDSPLYAVCKGYLLNPYYNEDSLFSLHYLLNFCNYSQGKLNKISYTLEDYSRLKTIYKIDDFYEVDYNDHFYFPKIRNGDKLLRTLCLFLKSGKYITTRYL